MGKGSLGTTGHRTNPFAKVCFATEDSSTEAAAAALGKGNLGTTGSGTMIPQAQSLKEELGDACIGRAPQKDRNLHNDARSRRPCVVGRGDANQ